MKIVEVIVEHACKNLSAYIEGAPVITVGNDMCEVEENMKEAIELYLEDNPNPCELLSGEFELKFKIDAATFINYMAKIENEIEYDAICQRVEELLPMTDDNTPLTDPRLIELRILSELVLEYEEEHYPIEKPTVSELIELRLKKKA